MVEVKYTLKSSSMTKRREPKPALNPDTLYIEPMGRVHCGELRCAGMAAYYTGRTLHGALLFPLSPSDGDIACETCGHKYPQQQETACPRAWSPPPLAPSS